MIGKLQGFYGFTRMPFGRDLAPGMLHRHAAHGEAAARITWCVGDKALGVITGEVGAGKTHLATALGHIAVRRRLTVHMARADQLFKRLKAARLDNSTEAEHRRLAAVNVLIIDDLALTPLDETATTDFYELTVARHRHNATVVTSNRTPDEWLGLMHDQLLAQSAVDRLTSTCHELVIEGDSYRKRQRPSRHPA